MYVCTYYYALKLNYYFVLSEYSCSSALMMAANDGGGVPSCRLRGLDNFCHPDDLHVLMNKHAYNITDNPICISICTVNGRYTLYVLY